MTRLVKGTHQQTGPLLQYEHNVQRLTHKPAGLTNGSLLMVTTEANASFINEERPVPSQSFTNKGWISYRALSRIRPMQVILIVYIVTKYLFYRQYVCVSGN